MARLFSTGYESNSTTLETFTILGNTNPTIQTTIVRTGTYAMSHAVSSTFSSLAEYQFSTGSSVKNVFGRIAFYATANPASNCTLATLITDNGSGAFHIRIKTDGTVKIYDNANGTEVGSASSAITLSSWNYVEFRADITTPGSTSYVAKLNGTQFSTATVNITGGAASWRKFQWGTNLASSGTYTLYTDDIALNDSSGSYQNSYPGDGHIIHLKPNAAGDNTAFTRGGTDSGNNWDQVNEVTPDTADYVTTSSSSSVDDYNIDNSGLSSSDTINVVAVGIRYTLTNTGDAGGVRLKATSGGTVTSANSLSIAVANTYVTNTPSTVKAFPIVSYVLPGTATPWTQSTVDSAQIGLGASGIGFGSFNIATLWLLVDYTPVTNTYTRGAYGSLPTTDADLTTTYSTSDNTDVSSSNDVWVGQAATAQYAIHQFKDLAGSSNTVVLNWEGKSSLAPSASSVVLQIYNRNTTTWDTVATNNSAAANTDFTFSPTVTPLTDYKDGSNMICCRVYQLGL